MLFKLLTDIVLVLLVCDRFVLSLRCMASSRKIQDFCCSNQMYKEGSERCEELFLSFE